MLMISSSLRWSSSVPAAQQSSITTTLKLSSARLRTVEDTHWSVKMPGQDDVLDIHAAQDKAQVRAGEGAVRRLAQDDLVIARGEVGNELRFLAGSRHEQIVPPGFFLAQRAVPTVRLETGDPGEQALDAMLSEEIHE